LNRLKIERMLACSLMLVLLSSAMMAASAAEDKDILRLGLQSDKFTLMNPFVLPWGNGGVFGLTHVPLAVFKPDLSPGPSLAKSWDISSDGKSITFHLMNNASWHDGKPVTSEDVAFSFEYWKKTSKTDARNLWLNASLDNVEVIDKDTVEVTFKEPLAVATLAAQIPIIFIVPKHIWESVESPDKYEGSDAMVGCGPFVFESYDKDAQVVYLKANDKYFAGKPSVDKIEWRYYRSLDSALLALKKGDIDGMMEYYQPIPGVYAADLIKSGGIDPDIVPDIGVPEHLIFGFREYPSNVTEFRRAVSYAIDYDEIVSMIAAGYGEVPGKGYNSPALPGYDSSIPKLEYSLDKAKEMLNSSGFIDRDGDGLREAQDGSKMRLALASNPKPQLIRTAEVVSSQLRKAGLDVYVPSLTKDEFRKVLYTDKNYTMAISQSTPFGNLGADSASSYFVDLPGMYGTSKDPEIIELENASLHSKDMDELTKNRKAIQAYVAKEQPMIALIWGDAIYPVRTDRWDGWVPMNGYGPATYWSWFSLKPVGK
jgi:peptide/nickel transport system substrate-binding protein